MENKLTNYEFLDRELNGLEREEVAAGEIVCDYDPDTDDIVLDGVSENDQAGAPNEDPADAPDVPTNAVTLSVCDPCTLIGDGGKVSQEAPEASFVDVYKKNFSGRKDGADLSSFYIRDILREAFSTYICEHGEVKVIDGEPVRVGVGDTIYQITAYTSETIYGSAVTKTDLGTLLEIDRVNKIVKTR